MDTDLALATKACDALNESFKRDPIALHSLFVNRVPCNNELVEDPHFPVDVTKCLDKEYYTCSAMGLVNAAVHSLTGYVIISHWSDPDPETKTCRLLGFSVKKHPLQ